MAEQSDVRGVEERQVYDSYKSILRISPSMLDGELVDNMTLSLKNPKESDGSDRITILSDSEGIRLGMHFTTLVRETEIENRQTGQKTVEKIINVVTNSESDMYVVNDYNIRSTLVVNDIKQTTRVAPIQVFYMSLKTVGGDVVYDVLNYPVDSPNDNSYFNSKNKLKLIDYTKKGSKYEQLKQVLASKSKAWYDQNISTADMVKVGGKNVYTVNTANESIPVVYTKDYVLGYYKGHSAVINDAIADKYIGKGTKRDFVVATKSVMTQLSFIQLDKLVWDTTVGVIDGSDRKEVGLFDHLGVGQNLSITQKLFGTSTPPYGKTQILGTGVPSGMMINYAMPFRRYIFHTLRKAIQNANDEGNSYAGLSATVKKYVTDGKITPTLKLDPGDVNNVASEYVLCDGRELNYTNYPNINTDSGIFQHDDKGVVKRDSNKKPLMAETLPEAHAGIKNSNINKKYIVPSMFAFKQLSPRYIRGLNWLTNKGVDTPIDFDEQTTTANTFRDNDKFFQVTFQPDACLTTKNFSIPGVYRFNADWKIVNVRHRHLCFYHTDDYNRDNTTGNNYGKIVDETRSYQNGMKRNVRTKVTGNVEHNGQQFPQYASETYYEANTASNTLGQRAYTPYYWNTELFSLSDAQMAASPDVKGTTSTGQSDPTPLQFAREDKKNLVDYSFQKNKKTANGITLTPNTWDHHMPVPCAAMFAWRIQKDGSVVEYAEDKIAAGEYIIPNHDQEPVALDIERRKWQMDFTNEAEGFAPITDKGGTSDATGIYTEKSCTSTIDPSKKAHVEFLPYTGGYRLLRATTNTQDVPRFVTSLPHELETLGKVKPKDPPPTYAQMGDVNVKLDRSLSFPPASVMLPLLKI